MQKNPFQMTLQEIEREIQAAEKRIQADAVRALGSREAVARYERLRRRAERIGPQGDAAFDALRRFENRLSNTQRRLLFGDRSDSRLDPEGLAEVRKAFELALLAEQPEHLFPELRRNLSRVDPARIEDVVSLSGPAISRRLPEITAAIRIREAVTRLRGFGISDADILKGVFRDYLLRGVDAEDAWFIIRRWVGFAPCGEMGYEPVFVAFRAGQPDIEHDLQSADLSA